MRPRQPRSWIFTIALVSALLYGALQFSPSDLMKEPEEPAASFPEAYLIGMQDRTFNREGRLAHTLSAAEVTYFNTGANTQGYIDQPILAFFSADDPRPWYLTASQGIANAEQQTLLLTGAVNAYNEHPRYGRIDINTDDLLVNTDAQIASTDKPVTMQSARGTTSAIGLAAELESGRVQLLSEVKGTYAPN